MLAHLAKEHAVHLGTFGDDQAEMRHAERLRQLIRGEFQLVRLGATARMRMVTAFARGAPVSVSYFLSPTLARWVNRILRERDIDRAIVFSTAMAPYLLGRRDLDPGRVTSGNEVWIADEPSAFAQT